jgi:hypothetical protein
MTPQDRRDTLSIAVVVLVAITWLVLVWPEIMRLL